MPILEKILLGGLLLISSQATWAEGERVYQYRPDGSREWSANYYERIPRVIGEKMGQYDPRLYIENLKEQAALLVNHIINLIVIFVLQTIVIPLALIWALYRLCLALIHSAEQKKPLLLAM